MGFDDEGEQTTEFVESGLGGGLVQHGFEGEGVGLEQELVFFDFGEFEVRSGEDQVEQGPLVVAELLFE